MFVMYDSVDLSQIPAEPHAVLAYVNGQFANVDQALHMFPHARLLGMSVTGNVAADGYDIEEGDYEPAQVPDLYHTAIDHGIWRPCFYAGLMTRMPAVKAELERIAPRSAYRLIVASWDGVTVVPAGYDAHQFTNRALGRNLDESICLDTFFQAANPKPAVDPSLWAARVTVDPQGRHWTIEPLPAEKS